MPLSVGQPNIWGQLRGGAPQRLQGTSPTIQGSSPNIQGSSPNLQPAVSPIGRSFPAAGGRASAATTAVAGGGGGGGVAPTAAQIAAAQQAQELGGLRSEVIARRDRANQIFDALTGAVNALAQEKRNALESQFQQQQTRATEDFTTKGDQLQQVYAARGLGDSSYRINAIDQASREYQRSLEDLGSQRQSGLSRVGGEASGALAQIGADRGSVSSFNLDEVGRREDGTYDPNALRELRNSLDERIRKAEVQQAQFGTEQGFRGRLDQIAPVDNKGALQAALNNLIQSAAPKVVKDRLASAIISNYDPANGQMWQNFYDQESKKTQSATNVA